MPKKSGGTAAAKPAGKRKPKAEKPAASDKNTGTTEAGQCVGQQTPQ